MPTETQPIKLLSNKRQIPKISSATRSLAPVPTSTSPAHRMPHQNHVL